VPCKLSLCGGLIGRQRTIFVTPVLQALVVADRVYEDKGTGKKIIAGTFSRLFFKKPAPAGQPIQIPPSGAQMGSPFAYISLTDIHGAASLIIRYIRLDGPEGKPVFQTDAINVRCEDRLATVELAIPLPPLPIIKGVFALEVLCEGELLGSHKIVVDEAP
jgi:hypothetical protein